MYRRFLNNNDYLGIITQEALAQLTRGNDGRFVQAEESAEISIVEYLSENYEVEKELARGKSFLNNRGRNHISISVSATLKLVPTVTQIITQQIVKAV